MNGKYYITTPIYYVNDVPHIGHAYTSIATDVIARFQRLNGKEVMFLTGTDEHGEKVEKSAIKAGIDTKSFTDKTSASFSELMTCMNIAHDDFIRTTSSRHKECVRKFWQKLQDSHNIYLGTYSGWYSIIDEAFYDKTELTSDGKAPTGTSVQWVDEPSYFFALSKWQDKLLEFYDANPNFIMPLSKRSEVINFVKNGLQDLSISRTSFTWGVKVPGDEGHVIYVWLDALVNYISALGYPEDHDGKYAKYWPADVHIVGKDILRFHAIYWPAFLMAAGLKPPKSIMAHGWWTNQGQKISKSLGNVIDPFKLSKEFGVDQVRYFMMREITFGADGNYSSENLIARVNSELANKIGNLMQRTSALVHKYYSGKVPQIDASLVEAAYNTPLMTIAVNIARQNIEFMESLEINSILCNIITIAEQGNLYIDQQAPWKLTDTDPSLAKFTLFVLLEILRFIAIMLQPFTPKAASAILDQLSIPYNQRNFAFLNKNYIIQAGSALLPPSPVFPKIDRIAD